jgi:hypothetical protein
MLVSPRNRLQTLTRERQREVGEQIGVALQRQRIENALRMDLEFIAPVRARSLWRHRGKKDRALRHMRIAILAHHVVAHQPVHQAGRLVRRKHVDALLRDEDIVAPREQRGAKLRYERDRRVAPHPRQRRIRVAPKLLRIDVEMRRGGHGGSVTPRRGNFRACSHGTSRVLRMIGLQPCVENENLSP